MGPPLTSILGGLGLERGDVPPEEFSTNFRSSSARGGEPGNSRGIEFVFVAYNKISRSILGEALFLEPSCLPMRAFPLTRSALQQIESVEFGFCAFVTALKKPIPPESQVSTAPFS